MKKPPYLSSKKWNKKFKKNVKKFQNFSDPSSRQKLNKSLLTIQTDSVSQTGLLKKWVLIIGICTFVKDVIANMFVKLTNKVTELINRGSLGGTATVDLETRIENLEETLKEYAKKIQVLELEVAKHSERLAKVGSQQHIATNVELVSGPHIQTSVPPTAPSLFPSVPPPPPPPPPPPLPPPPLPPLGTMSVQNQLSAKKTATLTKKTQLQLMRPAISLEDIINVKLKRTPCAQRTDKLSRILTPSNNLPRISLEALRSVKLKKTSLLKETSPVKSKSPKGKIRHALRRLPVTTSPGGTPKYERICQEDDMTPVMSRVLLKRFNAFQMSPDEENKENDIQFL